MNSKYRRDYLRVWRIFINFTAVKSKLLFMIECIAENLCAFWLVITVLCLIVELCTGGFFIVCFAFGALCGALATLFGGFYLQLAVFVIFTAIGIFLVRPLALNYLNGRSGDRRLSNADALIGRTGIVSQTIEHMGYGRVAIDGDDWKARTDNGDEIKKGERVIVTGRESIILTVTKTYR